MTDRSSTRSQHYQQIFAEISCDPETLAEKSDAQGLSGSIYSSHNEELLDLKEKLIAAFWRLVETGCSKRQQEVLKYYSQGLTQVQISKILGVNQSSITKSIHGNADYRHNTKRLYGGSKKLLMKLAKEDLEVQEIFQRIAELQEEE